MAKGLLPVPFVHSQLSHVDLKWDPLHFVGPLLHLAVHPHPPGFAHSTVKSGLLLLVCLFFGAKWQKCVIFALPAVCLDTWFGVTVVADKVGCSGRP